MKKNNKKLVIRKPIKYLFLFLVLILVFWLGTFIKDIKIPITVTNNIIKIDMLNNISSIYNDNIKGLPAIIKKDAYGNMYFSDTSNSWIGVWAQNYFHGIYGWRPFLNSSYRRIDYNSLNYFFETQASEDNEFAVKGTFPVFVYRNSPTTSLSEAGYWFGYHNNIDPNNAISLLGCDGNGYDINVDTQYLTIISASDYLLFERNLKIFSEWYPKMIEALEGLDKYASSSLGCIQGLRQKYKGIPESGIQGTIIGYGQNNNQFRSSTLIYAITAYERLIEVAKFYDDEANIDIFIQKKAELEEAKNDFMFERKWFIGGKTYLTNEYIDNFETSIKFDSDAQNNGCQWVSGAGGSLTCENSEVIYTFNYGYPINFMIFESASKELGENLFYADGNNQTLTITFSNDGTNWISAYTYVWTEAKGIRPIITLPAELRGSTTIYLKIIAQAKPGKGIQWYSIKIKYNSAENNMQDFGSGMIDNSSSSYFETYPNIDGIMLGIVNKNQGNKILDKIESIPELTKNSPILINYPARPYEEMTHKINIGSDINGGWWWSLANSAVYAYIKQEHPKSSKYLQMLWGDRQNQYSKNYYNNFGSEKEPSSEITLSEIGNFGSILRAMFDIKPNADTLDISPHIWGEIESFSLKLPIYWGDKEIYLQVINNHYNSSIQSVFLNEAEYSNFDKDTLKLNYSDLIEVNTVIISYKLNEN